MLAVLLFLQRREMGGLYCLSDKQPNYCISKALVKANPQICGNQVDQKGNMNFTESIDVSGYSGRDLLFFFGSAHAWYIQYIYNMLHEQPV